jgi:hypothetical protein
LPGAPGSPIDYDSTVLFPGPDSAKGTIESELEEKCGPDRCGVTVDIVGEGPCALSARPAPVEHDGKITIQRGFCEFPPDTESVSEPEPEPDTGETTTEAG